MPDLQNLRIKSMELYFKYKDGLLSLEEYIQKIKPLDHKIDKLELQNVNYCLVDNSVSQIAFLKHLH